jgi:hypothetical protein
MSIARRKSGDAPTSWEEVKRSWMNFGKDLMAFASLQFAWFIVWRALRHRRRWAKQQAHASELRTENSAGTNDDGKTLDSSRRETKHEGPLAGSIGQGRHDGLS